MPSPRPVRRGAARSVFATRRRDDRKLGDSRRRTAIHVCQHGGRGREMQRPWGFSRSVHRGAARSVFATRRRDDRNQDRPAQYLAEAETSSPVTSSSSKQLPPQPVLLLLHEHSRGTRSRSRCHGMWVAERQVMILRLTQHPDSGAHDPHLSARRRLPNRIRHFRYDQECISLTTIHSMCVYFVRLLFLSVKQTRGGCSPELHELHYGCTRAGLH